MLTWLYNSSLFLKLYLAFFPESLEIHHLYKIVTLTNLYFCTTQITLKSCHVTLEMQQKDQNLYLNEQIVT